MEHVVEIDPVDEETAALLQISVGASAFHVDRLTFTINSAGEKVPAVLFQAVYRQEQYAIHTQTL
jgi:DNA-binding GntR family transcriptional regulator